MTFYQLGDHKIVDTLSYAKNQVYLTPLSLRKDSERRPQQDTYHTHQTSQNVAHVNEKGIGDKCKGRQANEKECSERRKKTSLSMFTGQYQR